MIVWCCWGSVKYLGCIVGSVPLFVFYIYVIYIFLSSKNAFHQSEVCSLTDARFYIKGGGFTRGHLPAMKSVEGADPPHGDNRAVIRLLNRAGMESLISPWSLHGDPRPHM